MTDKKPKHHAFALSALALSATTLLALSACGGGSGTALAPDRDNVEVLDPTSNALSLNGMVYGAADTQVPAGSSIPKTMMEQMRALFDLIKAAPDFTKIAMDLGDGTPVKVLDTNTGDKFLPGKLALGLSYILIDMKTKNDPAYADYLATYKKVTEAMIRTDPTTGNYVYANTSWGEYYYLVALNNLKAQGMLNEAFSDATLALLQKSLSFCDMFGPDASGTTDTCPALGTPIDVKTLNTAQNYYAVSYGIAGLRQKLGWDNPTFNATDPNLTSVSAMNARDALLYTLEQHIRSDSSGGFSDEASNKNSTYYDQARFDRYSTLLIGEVVERTFEMDNTANLGPELKGYLRKSVDLILPQLNVDGKGFNYGRSIGPYGDTAFMEVLTAAAKAGVLTAQETNIAYSFIYKAAQRFNTFWYDPTLPTPSVNMWVKGRGTDAYRGKPRVMGENFSLLHQFLYVNNRWNEMGFKDQTPLTDSAFQSWLDSTQPRHTLTWYNLPTDSAHPYSAALITVRDKKRVINLNLSQAPDYNSFTPYFPTPFADKLIYGTTDLSYALLVPQVTYGGKQYLPVTYYKNLAVNEDANGVVTVSYTSSGFRQAAKNAKTSTDIDLQANTVLTFNHGSITRTDTLSSKTLSGQATVETDFSSFAPLANTQINADGVSLSYNTSDVTRFSSTGFNNGCQLSSFVGNPLSTTPIGQLNSLFVCTSTPFALNTQGGRSFSWTINYADLP